MNWPWVRRKTWEEARDETVGLRLDVKERDRALSKMGHEKQEAFRQAEQLCRDLRILAVHLEDIPPGDRIEVRVVIHHELIYHSYRRDSVFRDMLGSMLEREFERSEAGRSMLVRRPSW